MNERLSSLITFYFKMLLPVLWITGFGFGTLAMWLGCFQPQPEEKEKLMFLLAWIIGSAFFIRDMVRLKTVISEGNDLIIKNFSKTVRVPIRDINHITESRLRSPKTVSLTIYPPSEFGDKITFIPKAKFRISFNLFGEHPIVTRLRQLIGVQSPQP